MATTKQKIYIGELPEYISICVECGEQSNDNNETRWNMHGEPLCSNCWAITKNESNT